MLWSWPSIGVGILTATITIAVAVVIGGAGHGWITPFWFSLLGFLAFPVAFVRLPLALETENRTNAALVMLALILDGLLVYCTLDEGTEYFHRVGVLAYVWLALWSIWQIVVVATSVRRWLD